MLDKPSAPRLHLYSSAFLIKTLHVFPEPQGIFLPHPGTGTTGTQGHQGSPH